MNDSSRARTRSVFPGLAFIIGMVAFALIVRQTVLSAKRLDEYVTVKGLSEREVPADLAIWPISLSVMEDELASLQGQIAKARATVHGYLLEQGFEPGEVSQSPPQIHEQTATNEGEKPRFRFRAGVTVLLRTTKVAKAKAALETSDRLVEQGIVLTGGEYSGKPQFLFTGLNKIKPEMIGEANRNARKAAERFAEDSAATVGTIKHAVQGPFEINDLDPSTPDRKIVRVVTTVDFYLK